MAKVMVVAASQNADRHLWFVTDLSLFEDFEEYVYDIDPYAEIKYIIGDDLIIEDDNEMAVECIAEMKGYNHEPA